VRPSGLGRLRKATEFLQVLPSMQRAPEPITVNGETLVCPGQIDQHLSLLQWFQIERQILKQPDLVKEIQAGEYRYLPFVAANFVLFDTGGPEPVYVPDRINELAQTLQGAPVSFVLGVVHHLFAEIKAVQEQRYKYLFEASGEPVHPARAQFADAFGWAQTIAELGAFKYVGVSEEWRRKVWSMPLYVAFEYLMLKKAEAQVEKAERQDAEKKAEERRKQNVPRNRR